MHPRDDIERYLAEGLPAEAEQALRSHLRDCASCRGVYDDELRLRRALAGAPHQPTRAEDTRLRQLVLARAGLAPTPSVIAAPRRALGQRIREQPWYFVMPVAAAAIALLIGAWGLRPGRQLPPPISPPIETPSAPVASITAAHLKQAKDAALDGTAVGAGTAVSAGAVVAVGAEGLAELELVRGGRVRLFSNTRLKMTPRGESIELLSGKIWCEVESGRGRFMVRTERGEARVLGTSFVVDRAAVGDTEVRVLSGIVEVEDAAHRGIVRVTGGQRTRLLDGEAPARALRYDTQADLDAWEQSLRKLGRDVERTLRKLGGKLRLP